MRFAPFLLLAACPVDPGIECSTLAAASVTISVTDPDGSPLAPTSVTWSVDGGAPTAAECMNEDCTEFVAGWEVEGEITVSAELSGEVSGDPCCFYDSTDSELVTIELDGDGCHVVGQSITLVLDPSETDCADCG